MHPAVARLSSRAHIGFDASNSEYSQFKVDRLQIIVVAKKYIYVSQLFISTMPKMRAIPQLVSAPLNPIPIVGMSARSLKVKA